MNFNDWEDYPNFLCSTVLFRQFVEKRRSEGVKRRLSLSEKQKCFIILDQLPNGLSEAESLSKVIPTVFQFLMSLLFKSSRLFWTPVCRWAICGFHPKRTVLIPSNTEHYFGALVIRLCRWFDWFWYFSFTLKREAKNKLAPKNCRKCNQIFSVINLKYVAITYIIWEYIYIKA